MRIWKLGIFIALALVLSGPIQAEPYALGWEDINTITNEQDAEYTLDWEDTQVNSRAADDPLPEPATEADIEAQAEAEEVAAQPPTRRLPRTNGGPLLLRSRPNIEVPSFDIELSAMRRFDSWTDRYRSVHHVEVMTYRGGYPQHEVFENTADFFEFEVYLNDMKPGDRYEAKVVWDDGSFRYLEQTIDRFPDLNVIIDEPL